MQWWGQVSWCSLVIVLGSAQLQVVTRAPQQCRMECMKVYSLHNSQEQSNYSLDACVKGCDTFTSIEYERGSSQPLDNLKNCNFSCDERYEGSLLPACQSGCGFHFDNDVTQSPRPSFRPRSDAPIPIFSRPMTPVSQQPISSVAPSQQPMRSEAPMIPFRPPNPFLNIFRSQQSPPLILRKNVQLQPLAMMPRSMSAASPDLRPVQINSSPEFPDQHQQGPTVIGFNLPQLLNKVNSLIPQLTQGRTPKVLEISVNRNPFSGFQERFGGEFQKFDDEFHNHHDEMDLPELPRMMQSLFGGEENDIEPLLEEVEDIFGNEEEIEHEVEHFMEDSMFGRKDDDVEPFSGLFSQFGRMMNSLPQLDNLRNMMPWSGGVGGGKLTVIKAGPGFHEEKSFDIGADGHITEVKPITMMKDGLDHHNPMDNMFNSEDVEMFHVDVEPQNIDKIDTEPVMDVRDLEDEPVKETVTPEAATKEVEEVEKLPYLSVLRNNVEQEEEEVRNWSEKLLNQYRRVAEREYLDSECSSQTLSWSDWVSCLHSKVGVPRWLTAATISLGIIFSLWLCLVIPSTAPKRKMKTLFIRGDKPSVAVVKAAEAAAKAKAKEAEAAGNFKAGEYMVAVINVDMPPTYGEVTPGSPAPSYKSDMASQVTPASPAPSYKSVDHEATKVALEPVHGKKESNA